MGITSPSLSAILMASLLLASCTIQKRYHHRGWNVESAFLRNKKQGERVVQDAVPDKLNRYSTTVAPFSGAQLIRKNLLQKGYSDNDGPSSVLELGRHKAPHFALTAEESSKNLKLQGILGIQTFEHQQDVPAVDRTKQRSKFVTKTQVRDERRVHWAATTALVFAVLGIIPGWGFVSGALAMLFGIIALIQIKKNPGKFAGIRKAIVSMIIGLIAFIGWLVFVVLVRRSGK